MAFNKPHQSIAFVNGKISVGTYIIPVRVSGELDSVKSITKEVTGLFKVYQDDHESNLLIYYFPIPIGEHDGFICRRDSVEVI